MQSKYVSYFHFLPSEVIVQILATLHMPDVNTFLKAYPEYRSLNFEYMDKLALINHKFNKSGWICSKCKWCGQNVLNKSE